MSISVIIVNYRTPELSIEAAQSALADSLVKEVIIVNAFVKGDTSLEVLNVYAAKTPEVSIVPLPDNPGFGTANNRGAEQAKGDELFFLNSDATIEPGTLERLVSRLKDDTIIGLVAPPVYLPDVHTLQPDVCGIFPTPLAIVTRKTTVECTSESPDWVSGVALLARREQFKKVGGFDERMFMYYEDVELCHRYRTELGLACARFSDGPGVVHLGGVSKTSNRLQKASYYQSQDYYLKKARHSWFSRMLVKAIRTIYVLWKS